MPLTLSVVTSAVSEMPKGKAFPEHVAGIPSAACYRRTSRRYHTRPAVETGVWVKVRRVSCLESEQNVASRAGWNSPDRFNTNVVKWWAQ